MIFLLTPCHQPPTTDHVIYKYSFIAKLRERLRQSQGCTVLYCTALYCTCGGGDVLQRVPVLLNEPLDEVNLLQGDLHRVLVLGPARRVGHPQLQEELCILYFSRDIFMTNDIRYILSSYNMKTGSEQSGAQV